MERFEEVGGAAEEEEDISLFFGVGNGMEIVSVYACVYVSG